MGVVFSMWRRGLWWRVSMSGSWFSSGGLSEQFSTLTGQISNFTKEVLTEATQEVEGVQNRHIKQDNQFL